MTDGYVVNSTLPAAQLLQSILITYSTNQDVMLVLADDACAESRPSVVGAYIRRP
jgi:hypothetical protein